MTEAQVIRAELMKPGTVPAFSLIPAVTVIRIGYQGSNGHFG